MFTLYQKRQFIYPDKLYNSLTNSPISFIFNFWSQDISHYHNFKAQEDLKTYLWGKISFCSRYTREDIANRSSTSLTQTLNPRVFPRLSFFSVIFCLIGRFLVRFRDCKSCQVHFQKFRQICKRRTAKYVWNVSPDTLIPERTFRDMLTSRLERQKCPSPPPDLWPHQNGLLESVQCKKNIWFKFVDSLYLLFELQL